MGRDTHAVVEDNDALQRGTQCEDAMGLVVLLLLTHKKESNVSILNHILYLLLAGSGIDGDGDGTDAESTEVRIDILDAVLGEDGYLLLRAYTQIEHGITHLLHAQGELVP